MNDLIGLLAQPAFQQVAEKSFLGKVYIRLGRLIFVVGDWVFQRGALIGYGLRGEPVILGKLLGAPHGQELSFVLSLKKGAEDRLRQTPAEDFNFQQMYAVQELKGMGIEYPTWPPSKALERKCDSPQIMSLATSSFAAGAAFGHHFPDEFRACWGNSYRLRPDEEWQAMKDAGLELPETQQENPLPGNVAEVFDLALVSAGADERFSSDELSLLADLAVTTN
jgi:hypothetical protein